MAGADPGDTVRWLHHRGVRKSDQPHDAAPLYTIKDVVDACGLPGPVIMQLVPRTWTDEGWMYTREQLQASVGIAENLHRELAAERPPPQ